MTILPGNMNSPRKQQSESNDCITLVLQGGGALGAYQGGAFQALADSGHSPAWIAGISIGAINGAIIAGNKPKQRMARLRQFWDGVSAGLLGNQMIPGEAGRSMFNESSAWLATMMGINGFFTPRAWPPMFQPAGSLAALSYYDTAPLKRTLEELIDFDVLNNGGPRLSVGAVNVRTGNFIYFDSSERRISVDHIMASAALPPGFPPVEIDGEAYWDGGLVSNTPLQYVLDSNHEGHDLSILQVDLFRARGSMPQTIFDVAKREKEIRYSSRTRLNTTAAKELILLRKAAATLAEKMPEELRNDPAFKTLTSRRHDGAVSIFHLINRPSTYDTQSKDYEFSRLSMVEHWDAGQRDALITLRHPSWLNRARHHAEVAIYDLSQPKN